MKLAQLLADYESRLARAGVFAPRADALAVLAYVLNVDPEKIAEEVHRAIDPQIVEAAERIIQRREKREPLARILGAITFYGLKIQTASDAFRPCFETEALVEHVLLMAKAGASFHRILDLGTGTGCLLLALLRHLPEATGIGVDVDEGVLATARANAAANDLSERATFCAGHWGQGIEEKFDLVVCNPPAAATGNIPYMAPEMRDYDPPVSLDGGEDGLNFFRYAARDFGRLATSGGLGVFQVYSRSREANLFCKEGYPVEVKLNYLGNPCCLVVVNDKPLSFWQRVTKTLNLRQVRAWLLD